MDLGISDIQVFILDLRSVRVIIREKSQADERRSLQEVEISLP
jgi:hypothetical protein